MEDTGWYKARMEMAQPLNWGRNLGCEFAQRSCMEWMETKAAKFVYLNYFKDKTNSLKVPVSVYEQLFFI